MEIPVLKTGEPQTELRFARGGITAYEYVALKENPYSMSGYSGLVVIKFEGEGKNVQLKDIEWCKDEDSATWANRMFPKWYSKEAAKYYTPNDKGGDNILLKQMDENAEKEFQLPVAQNYLLDIDINTGKYKIIRANFTADGKIKRETVNSGTLKKNKKEENI